MEPSLEPAPDPPWGPRLQLDRERRAASQLCGLRFQRREGRLPPPSRALLRSVQR